MNLKLLAAFTLCAFARPSIAQETTSLAARAKAVAQLICAEPEWNADLFDESFLQAVPPERLKALCSDIFGKYGKVKAFDLQKQDSALAGKYEALLDKGFLMPVTIGLASAEPHSIVALWFGPPSPVLLDYAAVSEEFGKLTGKVSFGIYKLGDKQPLALVERDGDQALAIGSAFKLYVLGALARDVAEGKRHFEDTLRLEQRWMSMPSGKLQKWPVGTALTLASVAALMISESDNTATDHLLFTLGRTRVEAMLREMGNGAGERNKPFLSTGEMFRLKAVGGPRMCDAYLAHQLDERRAYLEQEIAALTLDEHSLDSGALARPVRIDSIEWFASAADLARAFDWLRKNSASEATGLVRGLLAINRGLDVPRDSFPYVGFKGGSETGVIELAFLLRSKAGDWYAVAAGWNDPRAAVDETRFAGLVTRAIHVLADEIERRPKAEKPSTEK